MAPSLRSTLILCTLLILAFLTEAKESFSAQKIRAQSASARRYRHGYPSAQEAPKKKESNLLETSLRAFHLRQDSDEEETTTTTAVNADSADLLSGLSSAY